MAPRKRPWSALAASKSRSEASAAASGVGCRARAVRDARAGAVADGVGVAFFDGVVFFALVVVADGVGVAFFALVAGEFEVVADVEGVACVGDVEADVGGACVVMDAAAPGAGAPGVPGSMGRASSAAAVALLRKSSRMEVSCAGVRSARRFLSGSMVSSDGGKPRQRTR